MAETFGFCRESVDGLLTIFDGEAFSDGVDDFRMA